MKNNEDICNLFGKKLKEERLKRNINQEELAFKSKLDRSFLSEVENGVKNPSLRTLYKLSTALDMELKDLLDL